MKFNFICTLKPGKKKIMFGMNVKILNFALVKFKNVLRLKWLKGV